MQSSVAELGRLWRTARWLKPEQILGRVRMRLRRPVLDLRPAPPLRRVVGSWTPPARREPSVLSPTRLRFLSETLDIAQVGWDAPEVPLLWRYNLHYFDDLNAAGSQSRQHWHVHLVQIWLNENEQGRGTAWAPFPVSLRIVNWVKWALGGQPMENAWVHSLAIQTRWLFERLEWHLLGNHLFANAKALVFAGLYFDGPQADAWLTRGLSILERELAEQILSDGGQFERSPMYHALALEDVLDLLNVIAACAPAGSPAQALAPVLARHASAMLYWLRCMRHPSGALARFNDSAEGIAPSTYELERYAAALGVHAQPAPGAGTLALQPSGYARVACGLAVAFIDVAPIGPDYLPGHAHADTLSFELSVAGCELVVNRGTSVYGTGPRRQWERGTAAHSTVQIGSHDSSEVWAGFRVGRRARPLGVRVAANKIEGAHDGYQHLPGSPVHHRCWQLDERSMLVQDRITPASRESAHALWHFAPGLSLASEGESCWRLCNEQRALATLDVLIGSAAVTTTQHALGFGKLVDAQTLCVRLVDGRADVRLTWTD